MVYPSVQFLLTQMEPWPGTCTALANAASASAGLAANMTV
eukprot:SAG25_NODE_14259_length_257_cov_0.651899_1_plen_39_part_01